MSHSISYGCRRDFSRIVERDWHAARNAEDRYICVDMCVFVKIGVAATLGLPINIQHSPGIIKMERASMSDLGV